MRVISNRPGARISGLLLLLAFLVAGLLVTGWFVARTESCRRMLAERLSDRLGVKVTIGDSRIGWPYMLVLRDVASAGFSAAGTPGFAVGELRAGRRLRTWRLELRHPTVRVQRDAAGVWLPIAAARLADLRQASAVDVVRATAQLRHRLRLQIADGSLIWLDAEGREEASLRDIRFRMEPVKMPEQRDFTYYGLQIYTAAGGAMGNVRDLHWVWLTSGDRDYVELVRAGRNDNVLETVPVEGAQTEAVYVE